MAAMILDLMFPGLGTVITAIQFVHAAGKQARLKRVAEETKKAFQTHDKNGNGKLECQEILLFLAKCERYIPQLNNMIDGKGTNDDKERERAREGLAVIQMIIQVIGIASKTEKAGSVAADAMKVVVGLLVDKSTGDLIDLFSDFSSLVSDNDVKKKLVPLSRAVKQNRVDITKEVFCKIVDKLVDDGMQKLLIGGIGAMFTG